MRSLDHVSSDKSIQAISLQEDDLGAVFPALHCCKMVDNLQFEPYQISRRSQRHRSINIIALML